MVTVHISLFVSKSLNGIVVTVSSPSTLPPENSASPGNQRVTRRLNDDASQHPPATYKLQRAELIRYPPQESDETGNSRLSNASPMYNFLLQAKTLLYKKMLLFHLSTDRTFGIANSGMNFAGLYGLLSPQFVGNTTLDTLVTLAIINRVDDSDQVSYRSMVVTKWIQPLLPNMVSYDDIRPGKWQKLADAWMKNYKATNTPSTDKNFNFKTHSSFYYPLPKKWEAHMYFFKKIQW